MYDSDGDSKLSFPELIQALNRLSKSSSADLLYEQWGADHTGAQWLGSELAATFHEADRNLDGTVSKDEFTEIVKSLLKRRVKTVIRLPQQHSANSKGKVLSPSGYKAGQKIAASLQSGLTVKKIAPGVFPKGRFSNIKMISDQTCVFEILESPQGVRIGPRAAPASQPIVMEGNGKSWHASRNECLKISMKLCAYEEICPHGHNSAPIFDPGCDPQKLLVGNTWAAIANGFNDWVQVTDPIFKCKHHCKDEYCRKNKQCLRHSDKYPAPEWNSLPQNMFNLKIYCCPNPPNVGAGTSDKLRRRSGKYGNQGSQNSRNKYTGNAEKVGGQLNVPHQLVANPTKVVLPQVGTGRIQKEKTSTLAAGVNAAKSYAGAYVSSQKRDFSFHTSVFFGDPPGSKHTVFTNVKRENMYNARGMFAGTVYINPLWTRRDAEEWRQFPHLFYGRSYNYVQMDKKGVSGMFRFRAKVSDLSSASTADLWAALAGAYLDFRTSLAGQAQSFGLMGRGGFLKMLFDSENVNIENIHDSIIPQTDESRVLFNTLDTNGNNRLEPSEICNGLRSMSPAYKLEKPPNCRLLIEKTKKEFPISDQFGRADLSSENLQFFSFEQVYKKYMKHLAATGSDADKYSTLTAGKKFLTVVKGECTVVKAGAAELPDLGFADNSTNVVGKKCVFPFFYKNRKYTKCTSAGNPTTEVRRWCATELNGPGSGAQATWAKPGKWGFCDCDCQDFRFLEKIEECKYYKSSSFSSQENTEKRLFALMQNSTTTKSEGSLGTAAPSAYAKKAVEEADKKSYSWDYVNWWEGQKFDEIFEYDYKWWWQSAKYLRRQLHFFGSSDQKKEPKRKAEEAGTKSSEAGKEGKRRKRKSDSGPRGWFR